MTARVAATSAATASIMLAFPPTAVSHGSVRPTRGISGETVFTLIVPNISVNVDVDGVSLAAPARTRAKPVGAPAGFQTVSNGGTVRWIGGRVAPGTSGTFRFRVFAGKSGTVALQATESFAGHPATDNSEFPLELELTATTTTGRTRLVPWVIGLGLLSGVMLALLVWMRRRWGQQIPA